MTFQLKVEETTYDLWLGVNTPLLLFEALGLIPLDRFLIPSPDGKPPEPTEAEKDSLNVANLFHSIKTYDSRHAIASILLGDAEFTPALPYTTARQLAQNLEILEAVKFITAVFNDYGERKKAEGEPEIDAPQSEPIQEVAIAQTELPLVEIPESNIAEGE